MFKPGDMVKIKNGKSIGSVHLIDYQMDQFIGKTVKITGKSMYENCWHLDLPILRGFHWHEDWFESPIKEKLTFKKFFDSQAH